MAPHAKLLLERDEQTGRLRLRVEGSKVVLLVGLAALGLLAYGLAGTARRVVVGYGAYEGTVVRIERGASSRWFGDDSSRTSRLIIRRPDGREITRYASEHGLATSRIEQGDYVVKDTGLFRPPRARDKQSVPEILEEIRHTYPRQGH